MRRGVTLVEALVGLAVSLLALGLAYAISHQLFNAPGRHSLAAMMGRSAIQKDAKVGLRRLIYRVREAIQVLEPLPGHGGDALVVRDITNKKLRIRRDPATSKLVSEISNGGAWTVESGPVEVPVDGASLPASFPVHMGNCNAVQFTALAPDCVVVQLAVASDDQVESFMTTIKLRNARLAY